MLKKCCCIKHNNISISMYEVGCLLLDTAGPQHEDLTMNLNNML